MLSFLRGFTFGALAVVVLAQIARMNLAVKGVVGVDVKINF